MVSSEFLVRRAVGAIRARYAEPLSLDDLARAAIMSKFHFLRTFRDVTGVTPARFLAAVRLFEAKRLLYSTELAVAQIAVRVGYGSPGTFTRRFTECVGLQPSRYRQMTHGGPVMQLRAGGSRAGERGGGALSGTVAGAPCPSCPCVVGLFDSPVPLGQAAAWAVVSRGRSWRMPVVPPGLWYPYAFWARERMSEAGTLAHPEWPLLVGAGGRLRVAPGSDGWVELRLRPPHWSRPPLLVPLPTVGSLRAGGWLEHRAC